MPKYYVTNGVIRKDNKSYRRGQEVTLTAEQAEALKNYVVLSEIANPDKPLAEKTVKELKELAKASNVEGYSSMDHDALLTALQPEV